MRYTNFKVILELRFKLLPAIVRSGQIPLTYKAPKKVDTAIFDLRYKEAGQKNMFWWYTKPVKLVPINSDGTEADPIDIQSFYVTLEDKRK